MVKFNCEKKLRLKIAVIVPSSSEALFDKNSSKVFGGANVQMYQIAKELGQCEDADCYTLTEDYPTINFDEQDSFKLIKTYRKNDPVLVKFWKYHRCLQRIRPDAILQHGLTFFSAMLAIYCKLFGIDFVFMFAHDVEVEGRYQESGKKSLVFKWLLTYSRVLLTQNLTQKNRLLARYAADSQIIRNGFYLKPPGAAKDDYVLWVARHSSWKRPELFVQLARQNPSMLFKMICPASSAAGYTHLKKLAEQADNLQFIEFVPFSRIDDYFAKAKIFVNTSDHEGFPQTFIQASMNGTPILSLNVNPDEVLTEYNIGYCCNNDFGLLSDKLNLLMSDGVLYQDMSRNAFHYAEREHDIRKNVRTILGLIKNIDVV